MFDPMYEAPTMHHHYKRDGVRCRPGESTGSNRRLVGVSLLYFVVIGSLCGAFHEVGQRSGYNAAMKQLDKQPRLWRCVLDPSEIESGVPAEVILPATNEEIALKTATERAQWLGRKASIQPCIANYPEILSMRITP